MNSFTKSHGSFSLFCFMTRCFFRYSEKIFFLDFFRIKFGFYETVFCYIFTLHPHFISVCVYHFFILTIHIYYREENIQPRVVTWPLDDFQ